MYSDLYFISIRTNIIVTRTAEPAKVVNEIFPHQTISQYLYFLLLLINTKLTVSALSYIDDCLWYALILIGPMSRLCTIESSNTYAFDDWKLGTCLIYVGLIASNILIDSWFIWDIWNHKKKYWHLPRSSLTKSLAWVVCFTIDNILFVIELPN